MRLRPVTGATLLALAALSLPGHAASLGDARALSSLGSPLRAEIALSGSAAIDVDCLRLRAPQAAQGLPALTGARLALRQQGGVIALLLTTSRPVAEPILSFVVEDSCGQLASREYALFLDPPMAGQSAAAAVAEPVAAASSDPAGGRSERRPAAEWEMVAGESLASLAQALYPAQQGMQQRFVAAVRRENPHLADADPTAALTAGTRLRVPRLRQLAAAPAGRAEAAGVRQAEPRSGNAPVARARQAGPSPAPQSGRQLRIESAPQEVIQELVAREKAAGVNVVDTPPVKGDSPLLAIQRKIAELELVEAQLRAQIAEIDTRIAMTRAQIAARDAAAAAVRPTVAAAPALTPAAPAGPPVWATLVLGGLIAIVGVGVGVGAAILLRRRGAVAAMTGAASPDATAASAAASTAAKPPIVTASQSHGERVHTHADDEAGGIEVADLNFVLGLHEGGEERPETAATKVLARYLEAKGLRTSVPWLALLDGFRGANLRQEYESLAQRIRGNYNVQVPSWDEPAEEPEAHHAERAPLEDYPHLVRRLTAAWGSELCLDFLDSLLQDNRNGTRKGFPMQVLGDILLLISIAEARREAEPTAAPVSAVVRPLRRVSS